MPRRRRRRTRRLSPGLLLWLSAGLLAGAVVASLAELRGDLSFFEQLAALGMWRKFRAILGESSVALTLAGLAVLAAGLGAWRAARGR